MNRLPNFDNFYPIIYPEITGFPFGNEPAEYVYLNTPFDIVQDCLDKSNYPYIAEKLSIYKPYRQWLAGSIWQYKQPRSLYNYINKYGSYITENTSDFSEVIIDSLPYAQILPKGAYLFHGGHFSTNLGDEFTLKAPFSTTLDPSIARAHAQHVYHKYNHCYIWVLEIMSEGIPAFVVKYGPRHRFRHEKEVILLEETLAKVIEIKQLNETTTQVHIRVSKLNEQTHLASIL